MKKKYNSLLKICCWAQGIYFFLTGIWPIVHEKSFLMLSGPKVDVWLVKSFGIVLAVIGLVLLSAAYNKRINKETFLLAVGSSTVISIVEVYYAFIDRIWDTYLLDAFIELVFILLWTISFQLKQKSSIK